MQLNEKNKELTVQSMVKLVKLIQMFNVFLCVWHHRVHQSEIINQFNYCRKLEYGKVCAAYPWNRPV